RDDHVGELVGARRENDCVNSLRKRLCACRSEHLLAYVEPDDERGPVLGHFDGFASLAAPEIENYLALDARPELAPEENLQFRSPDIGVRYEIDGRCDPLQDAILQTIQRRHRPPSVSNA